MDSPLTNLTIGTNSKLPSTHHMKVLTLTNIQTNKIVTKNLEAIHKAMETFIASENSQKLMRALSHNIRKTRGIKCLTGESVYFKAECKKFSKT